MTKKETHNVLPWMAGAILVLGLAVAAGLFWSRSVTVQKVSFSGNHFVTQQELEKQADVQLGVHPDSLNFMEMIRRIRQIRYVEQANVQVEPGGNLHIEIKEREPLALLADGSSKMYVDREGVKLPLILGKAVDVPILYGFKAKPLDDTLNSGSYRAVASFLAEVKMNSMYNATISEVAWSEEGVVALSQQNGVKLVFGKTDFVARLRNWKAFYGEVIRKKGINSMQSVDFRFKGQIVTREG